MTGEQPQTFEEMQVHIASIEKNNSKILKFLAAQDEEKKNNHEAIDDPSDYDNKDSKKSKHRGQEDDKEKEDTAALKAAIAAIAQEDDKEKREDMAKKAQDDMDENHKNHESRKADDNGKPFEDKEGKKAQEEEDEKKEARIASLERKQKAPIIENILKVASIVNPKQIKSITKDLKTASLEDVEELWNKHYKTFSASLGVSESPQSPGRFVPFQMNASLEGTEGEDDMYTASTPKEYSQLDTEKLYEKLGGMYG